MARFEHCHNPNGIETILRKLPIPGEKQGKMSDIYYGAYKETMDRIKHHKWSKVALSTVEWVALAKRPLTALELQHALAVFDGQRDFDSSCITDIEDIISSCTGLVIAEQPTNLIRFAHYTVQEYFDKHLCDHYPNPRAYIAKSCLTYLGFMKVSYIPRHSQSSADASRLRSYALIEYALIHWHDHAKEVEESLMDILLTFVSDKEIMSKVIQKQLLHIRVFSNDSWRTDCVSFYDGSSSLHIVAAFGFIKLAQRLQKDKQGDFEVLVNARDHNERTPLNLAAAGGHTEMVKRLIPVVEFRVGDNGTALIAALRNEHLETAKVLFAYPGLPINAKDEHGRNCLFHVFDVDTAELGLRCGAEADMPDKYGYTPLIRAMEKRHVEFARFFSRRDDVNLEQHDKKGSSLWHAATWSYTTEMVEIIVEGFQKRRMSLDVNHKDFKGMTPLHYAAKTVRANICRRLLDLGANVNARDNSGRVPMHYAASTNYRPPDEDRDVARRRTLALLLSVPGVISEARFKQGRTPLAEAFFIGMMDTQYLTFLVEEMHLDPPVRDKEGRPLTFFFCRRYMRNDLDHSAPDDENKLRYLLSTGISINERDKKRQVVVSLFR